MFELMSQADLAICPSSGLAHECIALRIPLIVGVLAENHANIAEWMQSSEVAYSLGYFTKISSENSLGVINDFLYNRERRENLIKNQREVLDKKSHQRLFNLFKS